MAETTVQTNNQVVKFHRDIIREVVRENLFSPYMGNGPTSIIHRYNDLKGSGDEVNLPIVAALNGNAVGSGTLVGNEEKIDNYGCRMYGDWARHAILGSKNLRHIESAPLFEQAKPLLSEWARSLQRDEIIAAFGALPLEGAPDGHRSDAGARVNGILYQNATAAQLNTWSAANSDRVLYGNTTANHSGTHSTDLAKVDTTADKFTAESGSLMKYMAKHTTPRIKPHMIKGQGREYFVAFHGSLTFRDLKADLKNSNTDGRPRDVGKNPIFQDGDLLWDGTLHVEVPEIDDFVDNVWTSLKTAGASSARVNPVFLCGQSAIGMPWLQAPRPTRRDETDYEFKKGVGLEMGYGVGKIFKKHPMDGANLKQWGVVTGFFAASGT